MKMHMKSVKWIADRLEGGYAVVELENGRTADIPLCALPDGVKEGDVIIVSTDEKAAQDRKAELDSLAKKLFK